MATVPSLTPKQRFWCWFNAAPSWSLSTWSLGVFSMFLAGSIAANPSLTALNFSANFVYAFTGLMFVSGLVIVFSWRKRWAPIFTLPYWLFIVIIFVDASRGQANASQTWISMLLILFPHFIALLNAIRRGPWK